MHFTFHGTAFAGSFIRSRLMLRVIASSSHFQSSKMHKHNSHRIRFDTKHTNKHTCRERWAFKYSWKSYYLTSILQNVFVCMTMNANIKWRLSHFAIKLVSHFNSILITNLIYCEMKVLIQYWILRWYLDVQSKWPRAVSCILISVNRMNFHVVELLLLPNSIWRTVSYLNQFQQLIKFFNRID